MLLADTESELSRAISAKRFPPAAGYQVLGFLLGSSDAGIVLALGGDQNFAHK